MELDENIFNQIHQYLDNNLEDEKRQKFEIEMNQNSELAQEVATQRKIKSGLKINNYKQQFADIHTKLKQENALPILDEKPVVKLSTTKFNLSYFAYAASIILMIGVGLFFYLKPASTESLAKIETRKNKDSLQTKKSEDTELANGKKTLKKSNSIDYNKIYSKNFSNNPVIENPFLSNKYGVSPSKITSWETDTLNLKKGIQHLESGKTTEAISEFQRLSNSKFENIRFHADWYLVMAYLREKDILKAKKQLVSISSNEKHIYLEDSKRIIESFR